MVSINLLPWRQARLKQEKRRFIGFFVIILVLAVATDFYLYFYITNLQRVQIAKIDLLKKSTSILEFKLGKIKELHASILRLSAKLQDFKALQFSKIAVIHLFDELINIIPDEIYLIALERKTFNLKIEGYAESNKDVAKLMRRIEHNPWLSKPLLQDLNKTTTIDNSRFSLSFTLNQKLTPYVKD